MPPRSSKHEQQSTTHYIPNRHSKAGLARLTTLEQLTTCAMGGVLTEQPDPTIFRRVLDIGCGAGSWVIEAAQEYPTMSLIGIDIDAYTINHARAQAEIAQVGDRVEFCTMDTLQKLEFADASFDLVNMRLASSFMRTWDWPHVLREMGRVMRPAGIIRVTETEMLNQTNSAALLELSKMLVYTFFRAGHLWGPEMTGVTTHLEGLLQTHGFGQLQTRATAQIVRGGTRIGQAMHEDMSYSLQAMRPFMQKWDNVKGKGFDSLCQQALADMQQSDFFMQWNFLTVWGTRSASIAEDPKNER